MKLEKLKCTFQGLDIRLESDKLCTSLKHSEMNRYQPFKNDRFDPSYLKTNVNQEKNITALRKLTLFKLRTLS